jgi:hypothetical protein
VFYRNICPYKKNRGDGSDKKMMGRCPCKKGWRGIPVKNDGGVSRLKKMGRCPG